jgi:hypothetical protein
MSERKLALIKEIEDRALRLNREYLLCLDLIRILKED